MKVLLIYTGILIVCLNSYSFCEISDVPLETIKKTPAPNVFFILDNSASMDSEFLTSDKEGDMWVNPQSKETGRRCYIFKTGESVYQDKLLGGEQKVLIRETDESGFTSVSETAVSDVTEKRMWKTQWHGYNKLYYSPMRSYTPWAGKSSGINVMHVPANPMNKREFVNLLSDYTIIDGISVHLAHYYMFIDNQLYLVNFTRQGNQVNRGVYLADTTSPGDNLCKVSGIIREVNYPVAEGLLFSQDPAGDLNNFICWFMFHRKRIYSVKYALSQAVQSMERVRAGIKQVCDGEFSGLFNIHAGQMTDLTANHSPGQFSGLSKDQSGEFLDYIYHIEPKPGLSSLRKALYDTGRMLQCSPDETGCPWVNPGGECQKSFAVVLTDGYRNGESPWSGSVNSDGDTVPETWKKNRYQDKQGHYLYADTYPDTLADIAMHFYERDLSLALENLVQPEPHDQSTHQHLITYALSFGVRGTLSPDAFQLEPAAQDDADYPVWPEIIPGTASTLDDLWHSTVNGHGGYLESSDPAALTDHLKQQAGDIENRVGHSSPVALSGDTTSDGTLLFRTEYSSESWSGDIKAFELLELNQSVRLGNVKWSAGSLLNERNWKSRLLMTYDPERGVAIPFRNNELNEYQKKLISENENMVKPVVDYLRGDRSREGHQLNQLMFRQRQSLLGDIIHSAPVVYKNRIFAGFNDGMLHVFDTDTGKEIMGYIPDMLMENMKYLADHKYGRDNGKAKHRMYVDQSPVIKEITDLNGKNRILLVCGLGGGGRGYFCLDISPLYSGDTGQVPSAYELSDMVLWEYPKHDSPSDEKKEMGFSFSEPAIVKSNLEDHPWVVLFGNGYQSENGDASLFILDALSGQPVKIINTGVAGNNGLSTPLILDSDRNGALDIVYAGDLLGNLWKFDLENKHPHYWKVAFHDGANNVPLFRARGREQDDNGLYTGESYPQPITVKPVSWYGNLPHGNLVVFGTGKYFSKHDLDDTRTQTLYGIWDYSDREDEFLGMCQRINQNGFREVTFTHQPESAGAQKRNIQLLEQTSIFFDHVDDEFGIDEKIQVLSSFEPVYDTDRDVRGGLGNPSVHAGWFYDFPQEGERVISSLNLHNRNLIFVSTKPVSSPCLCGGTSMINMINIETGGRPDHVLMDLNRDGTVNEYDKIILPDGISETILEEVAFVPSGIFKQSILHAPAWLSVNTGYETLDMFLFMNADGNIELIPEKGERTGMIYWGEY